MSAYRDKLLSIGYLGRGQTRDRSQDVRDDDGKTVGKAVTDQLNNTVTVYDNRQDVLIRAPRVTAAMGQKEVRP
jgi:hypothetical protein